MRQDSFSDAGFENYPKKTRKEQFLEEMDSIIPWKELTEVIEPFYPKPKGAGRRPMGIERMLRIRFIQHWFNLSDPTAEEVLYDSRSLRHFVGIDLGREPVPDETTICEFRHLMEKHNLGDQLFHLVNPYLQEHGMKARTRVESRTKLIHSVVAKSANVHDSQVLPDLLHGEETRV